MDVSLIPRDDHAEIRDGVRKLCARFPGEHVLGLPRSY